MMLRTKKHISGEPDPSSSESGRSTGHRPLRVWPGVVIVALQWLARFGLKAVIPGFKGFELSIFGGLAGTLAFVLWWLFFSRTPWWERLTGFGLMVIVMFATWHLNHESMGPLWLVGYALPVMCLAFVAWAVTSRYLEYPLRHITMIITILLSSGVWLLVRTSGVTGDHNAHFFWRWSATAEDKILARTDSEPEEQHKRPDTTARETYWPGFRGPERNSIISGLRIETDWSTFPPQELWRRPIGPGWSSFAVYGDLIFTQEQRGDAEVVSCYNILYGEPVWVHSDSARFFESNGGPGPRATPAVDRGRVYTLGATGILNALDALSGKVIWTRNAASDTDVEIPMWGFSGSPLVFEDLVIVALAGKLAAYDKATGEPTWFGPNGGGGYSSPHFVTIDGVRQILLQSNSGLRSLSPTDGSILWEHRWPGSPIVQPALTTGGEILISASSVSGLRQLAAKRKGSNWTVEEGWTSTRLKPYFNDFVIHKGHAFGFDGRILACIDILDGKRKWKGGRYGSGQLILLSDQDMLLILSEQGELALVEAVPEQFVEMGRFPGIKGKTWNHPVLARDILLIRNGEEMAAFRLSLAE